MLLLLRDSCGVRSALKSPLPRVPDTRRRRHSPFMRRLTYRQRAGGEKKKEICHPSPSPAAGSSNGARGCRFYTYRRRENNTGNDQSRWEGHDDGSPETARCRCGNVRQPRVAVGIGNSASPSHTLASSRRHNDPPYRPACCAFRFQRLVFPVQPFQ